MVGAFFFFLRAGRLVFLQKTEKKFIAPLSSVALCVLFDFFLAWYSLAAVLSLRIHFVQVRQLCTIILFTYRCALLGKGKVNFFSAEHIEEQQTRIREEISREYEDLLFTGKKDSNFDRDCQFIFPKELPPPPPSQPMKFRLSPFPFQMINPTCDLYSDWFFGFSYFDLPQYVLLLLSTCSHPVN